MRIGLISDTHGLLRPEAIAALSGVDHILHTGDIGDAKIIESLKSLAPVTAIRGNIDTVGDCASFPPVEVVDLDGHLIYMLHDLNDLDLDPSISGFSVVAFGHSHRAFAELRGGVLFFNPGSSGPRRFNLPVTLGILEIAHGTIIPRIVEISGQRTPH